MMYKGDKMSMVFVLPFQQTNDFSTFENCVLGKITNVTKDMQMSQVRVSLPK